MTQDAGPYRYWAFISYSSRDVAWARWLHRAIESYGVPARLVSRPTPAGEPAPKRLRPVFRDRIELPAAADLGAEIGDALRTSRYLIVVCSPNAARSQWVNKEIETFQSLERADRVFAVIVGGEPNAGDDTECFPLALRAAEPIAADARAVGDGKRDAKLKLLAGMLGVSFDALKRRDTRRRLRRLQAGIVLALILTLGFGALAVYAEGQRARAVEARQQAESILEYLLFDLRDQLAPIGRLDIVEDVQEKVDAYYRELGIEEDDPNTLRNRAAAHDNKGRRLVDQGDLTGAMQEYRAALAIAERLASSDPSNTDWQRDLSVSRKSVGDVLVAQGDLTGAMQEYQAALAIAESLASSDPSNTQWQRDLAAGHRNVGDVLVAQGDLTGAMQEYQAALAIAESLASSDPSNTDWQRDLSLSHNSVGDVLDAQGDLTEALREYRASLDIREHLASSDPSNTQWQRDLAAGHSNVGFVLVAQGDLTGALEEFRAALAIVEGLASSDPSNTTWQKDLSVGHSRVGMIELVAQGDLTGALQEFRAALAIVESLASSDPSNTQWQSDLSMSYMQVGIVLEAQGDLTGAMREYQAALAIAERLVSSDPTNTTWQQNLSRIRSRIDSLPTTTTGGKSTSGVGDP